MTLWRRARDAVNAIVLIVRAFPELGLYNEGLPRTRSTRPPTQLIRIGSKAIEQKCMLKLWCDYSARDLETIADFIIRSTQLSPACSERIRNEGVLSWR